MNLEEIKNTTKEEIEKKHILFNYLIKDVDNWKMPFGATIPEEQFYEYADAAAWFTGCKLEVIRIFKKDGKKFLDVFGEGYYNTIGA